MSHDRFSQTDRMSPPMGDLLANNDINGGVNEHLFADAYHGGVGPFERGKACGPGGPGMHEPGNFAGADFQTGGFPTGDQNFGADPRRFGAGPTGPDSMQFDSMNLRPPSMRGGDWRGSEPSQFRPGEQQPPNFMPPPGFNSDNAMSPNPRRDFADRAGRGEAPEFGPLSLLSGDNALTDDQKSQLKDLRDADSSSNINSSDLRQDVQKMQTLLSSSDFNAQDVRDLQNTINGALADQSNSMIEQRIKVAEILTPEQRAELSQKFDRGNDQT